MRFKGLEVQVQRFGEQVKVTVNKNAVARWKGIWPCSGLPNGLIRLVLDRRTLDVVSASPEIAGTDGGDAFLGDVRIHLLSNRWTS